MEDQIKQRDKNVLGSLKNGHPSSTSKLESSDKEFKKEK
jgi:hypothetical protein